MAMTIPNKHQIELHPNLSVASYGWLARSQCSTAYSVATTFVIRYSSQIPRPRQPWHALANDKSTFTNKPY